MTAVATVPEAAPTRRRERDWVAWSSTVVLAVMVLAVLLAPVLSPADPDAQDLTLGATPPSLDHLLGTDQLGRDLFSRLLHGGRPVLLVAGSAALLAGVLGIVLGITAGYVGRLTDTALSRLSEIQLALPTILLAIVVIGLGGTGLWVLVLILVLAEWPLFYRLSRGLAASLREQPFIRAARSYGASTPRIIVRHFGRAVLPVGLIAFTLTLANAIALESTLSYLGMGVQPPQSDWGSMVAQGKSQLGSAWWISVVPGVAIAVFVFASNRLGDRLADRFAIGRTAGEVSGA